MADISKINPGNGTTYSIKDSSAVFNLSVSGSNLTVTRRDNTTFTVSLSAADTKQTISASTGKVYLTGVASTATTSVGYANSAVYMLAGELYANKVKAVNGFFQTSDKHKKNIISDLSLEKVYDLIDKCQTIIYTLKDDPENKEQIGMVAQEIQEFFPEVISEDKDGMLSLDYSRLTVIIFKVLKDLIKRINKIEQKLN